MALDSQSTISNLREETSELFQSTGLGRDEYLILSIGLAAVLLTNDLKRITTLEISQVSTGSLFLATLCAGLLALLLAAVYRRFPGFRLSKQPPVVALIGFTLGLGVYLRLIALEGFWVIPSLYVFRLGTTLFFIVWAENILPYGIKSSLIVISLSLLIVGILESICSVVDSSVSAGLVIMAPFISMLMDSFLRRRPPAPERPLVEDSQRLQANRRGGLLSNGLILFCCTFVLGGMQTLIINITGEELLSIVIQASYGIGSILAGLLLMIMVMRFWKPGSVALYRLFVLPILMVSIYLSTLVTGLLSPFYVVPLAMGFKLSILFFVTPLLMRGEDSWLAPICITMFLYRLAQSLAVIPQSFALISALTAIVSILLICLTIQSFAAAIIQRESAIAWTLAINSVAAAQSKPASCSEDIADDLEDEDAEFEEWSSGVDERITRSRMAYERIADRYQLTKREADVLALLANKRSVPYIAEALIVSQNTAKTHVHNVYVKTGVHSKKELLELIARTESELAR